MYQKLYYMLFNALTDAFYAIEAQNYGLAKEIIRNAQIQAEEQVMEEEEEAVRE